MFQPLLPQVTSDNYTVFVSKRLDCFLAFTGALQLAVEIRLCHLQLANNKAKSYNCHRLLSLEDEQPTARLLCNMLHDIKFCIFGLITVLVDRTSGISCLTALCLLHLLMMVTQAYTSHHGVSGFQLNNQA